MSQASISVRNRVQFSQARQDVERFAVKDALVIGARVLAALWIIIPIYYMVITSVKSVPDMAASPPVLWPRQFRLDGWTKIVERYLLLNVRNSVIIATAGTVLSLASAIPAAYALTRMRLPSKFQIVVSIVAAIVALMPPVVSVLPLYYLASHLRLLDSMITLIVVYGVINSSFALWILRGIFQDVPMDVEEAAFMDGDTRLGALRRVIFPLCSTGLFAVAILVFIFNWSEFSIALFFVISKDTMTLPLGISAQIPVWELDWGVLAAAGTIAVIPVLAASFSMQRFLVRGLSFGVATLED